MVNDIKHIIVSRAKFKDKELFRKYLKICKKVLVPGILNQTNKNFEWCLMINKEDVDWVTEYLGYQFTSIGDIKSFWSYVKERKLNIQTRHDIDDFMSNNYVEKIQSLYNENIDKYNQFIIHAQPLVRNFVSGEESHLPPYGPKRNSMFLSLCQKEIKHHVFERKHGQMYEVAKHTILLPEGYTEWIRHPNAISIKKH